MKKLQDMAKGALLVLGTQQFSSNITYKKSIYTFSYEVDDGIVYTSTVSRAVILVEPDDLESTVLEMLVKYWLYIPEYVDDYSFAYSFTAQSARRIRDSINYAVIFTTTDCNAKCPYCYEADIDRRAMSDKVAEDVGTWLVKKNKKMTIKWFGGEPLLNTSAIDIISNVLNANGIDYHSSMTSNGYLFNTIDLDSSIELWKLRDVQITLDGLAETHDAIKGIEGCFEQTLTNVESLIERGIKVSLRLNFPGGNFEEIVQLADYLKGRFTSHSKLSVYAKSLYGNTDETIQKDLYSIQDYLSDSGLSSAYTKFPRFRRHHCMADSGHSVVINPDGGLALCEHYPDETYSSIYEDNSIIDASDYIRYWSEPEADKEECKTCFYKPMCKRLLNCDTDDICNQLSLDRMQDRIKAVCMYSYQQYKSKGGE